jgi:hypothetical protein
MKISKYSAYTSEKSWLSMELNTPEMIQVHLLLLPLQAPGATSPL